MLFVLTDRIIIQIHFAVNFSNNINVFFFSFLLDILPKKILARDYLKSLEQMQDEEADF